MGMEHGCKSNETMEAAVYRDPRILIIRLTCRREREFNFNSNQLSAVNYYPLFPFPFLFPPPAAPPPLLQPPLFFRRPLV